MGEKRPARPRPPAGTKRRRRPAPPPPPAAPPPPRAHQDFVDAVESLEDGFLTLDREWRFTYVNRRAAANVGFAPADLVGRSIWELFPALAGTEHETAYRRAMTEHVPVAIHLKGALSDRWYRLGVFPSVTGISVVWTDITDNAQAAEALRQSEARYRALFEHSIDAVFQTAPDGRVFAANQAACATFGMTEEEIVRVGREGLTDWSDQRHRSALAERGRSGYIRRELGYVRKDGTKFTAEVSSVILPDGTSSFVILRDITDRLRAAEALRLRAVELAAILDAQRDVVLQYDRDMRVRRANPAFRATYGFDPTGLHVTDIIRRVSCRALDGSPLVIDEQPTPTALRGASAVGRTYLVTRADGADAVVETSSSPIQWGSVIEGAVTVWHDITDQHRMQQSLREADRNKDAFLAMLSHELRNPLTPIRNSLFVLENVVAGGEQARRARAVIERQVDHLSRLVDDLLDMTRISRGKIQLRRERFDLTEVVRRAADDHRSLCEHAGLALTVTVAGGPVWIDGDAVRVAQCIGNLLANATKFTDRGGRVELSLTVGGAPPAALLRVRDTGIGVSPEMMPRLFNAFEQAESTLARTRGGLGLGLALVKGLVELQGGAVAAHSEGLGRGAEFTIRLPLAAEAAAPGVAAARPPTGVRRRVLVIEDNRDAAESLRDVLELDEHEVVLAASGAEGLRVAAELRPDVVLCDIGLPGMTGYEVAQALRADAALRSIYLVALSGYAQPEDRAKARSAGFDHHLAKPPNLDALRQLLGQLPGQGAAG